MTPLNALVLSLVCYGVAALCSLFLSRHEQTAITLSGILGTLGGILGLAAAAPILLSGTVATYSAIGLFPFTQFVVRFDPLAALMVGVISLLVTVCSLYSIAYVREYIGRGAWVMCFFMNTFIASMVALVVMDNALYFLIFFELMSLASYFLVVFDQNNESVSAGFLYFLIAHAGSILIMAAFFILYSYSGSMNFADFRLVKLPGHTASLVFVLAFLGFGAKAGMVPLHSWLPRAHPAAPSHASALMSGVMVKIGVFGIIKVGIDLLGSPTLWWGLMVLGFGAVSAVLGVLYALAEHDIKRLLAYHTVENIGIILLGVGTGMIAAATGHPTLAALGLMAGLYHLLNHAVFKGLLFLGAGSVLFRVHTKDMEHMGGLAKRMPITALCFLIGSMAISALPPLNGFVSEWFTYQALFSMSLGDEWLPRLAGPIAVVMLALTGALAVMCFVKVYGVTFSGLPRSTHAEHATEVPTPMLLGMGTLAVMCVLLGIGTSAVAPILTQVAGATLNQAMVPEVASGLVVFPANPEQATLSTPLIALLLLSATILPLLLLHFLKGARTERKQGVDAWACGYHQEESMTVSASGFTQNLRASFAPLYQLRTALDVSGKAHMQLDRLIAKVAALEPWWDVHAIAPIMAWVQCTGRQVQKLQRGDFRIYCLYIIAALVILLFVVAA